MKNFIDPNQLVNVIELDNKGTLSIDNVSHGSKIIGPATVIIIQQETVISKNEKPTAVELMLDGRVIGNALARDFPYQMDSRVWRNSDKNK